jgi:hypothetical protein
MEVSNHNKNEFDKTITNLQTQLTNQTKTQDNLIVMINQLRTHLNDENIKNTNWIYKLFDKIEAQVYSNNITRKNSNKLCFELIRKHTQKYKDDKNKINDNIHKHEDIISRINMLQQQLNNEDEDTSKEINNIHKTLQTQIKQLNDTFNKPNKEISSRINVLEQQFNNSINNDVSIIKNRKKLDEYKNINIL